MTSPTPQVPPLQRLPFYEKGYQSIPAIVLLNPSRWVFHCRTVGSYDNEWLYREIGGYSING